MQSDARAVIADLARVFRRLRLRWYVFGAQAVIAAGGVRFTADVDVTVEPPPSGAKGLVVALERAGFGLTDIDDVDAFISVTRVIPMLHVATGIPVDVVLAGTALEDAMFARAEKKRIGGVTAPFVALADLVALKLLAGRPKDIEDVETLVRARPPGLDLKEARRRVVELGAALDDSAMIATFDSIVGKKKKR